MNTKSSLLLRNDGSDCRSMKSRGNFVVINVLRSSQTSYNEIADEYTP